jgi:hypothetical protein
MIELAVSCLDAQTWIQIWILLASTAHYFEFKWQNELLHHQLHGVTLHQGGGELNAEALSRVFGRQVV